MLSSGTSKKDIKNSSKTILDLIQDEQYILNLPLVALYKRQGSDKVMDMSGADRLRDYLLYPELHPPRVADLSHPRPQ